MSKEESYNNFEDVKINSDNNFSFSDIDDVIILENDDSDSFNN